MVCYTKLTNLPRDPLLNKLELCNKKGQNKAYEVLLKAE